MTETAIRTEDLSRHFQNVEAVDGLNLEVPAGTVFGFLGPNGAGKTTTIHLLLGLLAPTRGRAEVLGFDTATQAQELRRHTGALLEHHGLYERLSAEENLEFYGRIHGLSRTTIRERARTLLEELGLWERRRDNVAKLSKGTKQKIAIARTLMHEPPLIFLDEPTAGHDPQSAAQLRDVVTSLARLHGSTVFLTTHNLVEAERICSRVAVIREGKLLLVGAPDELRAEWTRPRIEIQGRNLKPALVPRLRKLAGVVRCDLEDGTLALEFSDIRGHNRVPEVVRMVVAAGGQVEEVRRHRASLEELFLSLMEDEP